MKYVYILIFATTSISNAQQIRNEEELNKIQKSVFVDLMKIICENVGQKHTYINKLGSFRMIDDDETYVTSYKYMSNDFNFFVTIYNENNGIRFNSPNSIIYNAILDNGVYKEVHKEGPTSFLVYEYLGQSFLLNFSTDKKGRKHYIVDTYCLKN